jgi:hypothetical protein
LLGSADQSRLGLAWSGRGTTTVNGLIVLIFLPFVIGAVVGGLLGLIVGRCSNRSAGRIAVTGTLGGTLGGILFWVLQATVWGPLFKSWPKERNELGMGDFVSPIPALIAWGSMVVCGVLTGALASLLCLASKRSASQPSNQADETRSESP